MAHRKSYHVACCRGTSVHLGNNSDPTQQQAKVLVLSHCCYLWKSKQGETQ